MALGTRRSGETQGTPPPHAVERRIYVAVAPAVVWAALHDPRAAATLFPELRLGPPTGAWPAAGATRPARLRIGMLREPVLLESLEARPAARFRYRLTGPAIAIEWTWTLGAHAGGTRVIHAATGAIGDRWAGLLAGLGGDPLARSVETHLRVLKSAAEGTGR